MVLNRIISKIDNTVSDFRFKYFEEIIHKDTWNSHFLNLSNAELQSKNLLDIESIISKTDDLVAKEGHYLRTNNLEHFNNKYCGINFKVLVHVPSKIISPGGFSLFNNLVQSLNFIGIETKILNVGDDIKDSLKLFKPDLFISSDNLEYLSTIDWEYLNKYRCNNQLQIGLTASLQQYGNTKLKHRIKFSKKNNIDFFYSFRSAEYLNDRKEYREFFEEGFNIHTIEFGANPLLYFPLPFKKDLNYVFLASSNKDKRERYFEWLPSIFKSYSGFIDGPGWHKIKSFSSQETHKFLYARAKVGINLHIQDSINWPSELNERTYILAASGIPQLIDNAKLFPKRFGPESALIAKNPKEYYEYFNFIINNQNLCQKYSLNALKDVYDRHTTFHRAEYFLKQLNVI